MNEWNEILDRELWEPGSTDTRLELVERMRPLRFERAAHPLPPSRLGQQKRSISHVRRFVLALAAVLALVAVAVPSLLEWRLRWPEGRAWRVASAEDGIRGRLGVGDALDTGPSQSALVRIARIGWMRALEDTRLVLRSTGSRRHRLSLESGTIQVSVWAPPFSVFVSTPSGNVMDMGCEFVVTANEERTSLSVLSGWVQLENNYGDVLVPEGAGSVMTKDARPGVPVFTDAKPSFVAAVRSAETAGDDQALRTILAEARPRDALTLILLGTRMPEARERLLRRAHELAPVIDSEILIRSLEGSDRAAWTWIRKLPLPAPKGWKQNWRDAFRPAV